MTLALDYLIKDMGILDNTGNIICVTDHLDRLKARIAIQIAHSPSLEPLPKRHGVLDGSHC